MRRYFLLMAGLALVTTVAGAQVRYRVSENKVGGVAFYSSNYGIFGLNVMSITAGFRYPRANPVAYMAGAGLWFGAEKHVDGETIPLTFITYDPNSGTSWGYPGEHVSNPNAALPEIYYASEYDHATGNYVGGQGHSQWPLWRSPGMNTSTMLPGMFEPVNDQRSSQGGAYSGPSFVPGAGEQVFSRYHDGDLSRYPPDEQVLKGFPLGLQIQQNIFAWEQGQYTSAVLVQYQITNVSSDTLYNCVAGQLSDADIGSNDDDYARFLSERPELRAAYVWSAAEVQKAGVLGVSLIEAPVTDAQGFVDNANRGRYKQAGRTGSFQVWSPTGLDFASSAQRYSFLNSGIATQESGPVDLRVMLASTPFSMRPGDVANFTVLYMIVDERPDPQAPAGTSAFEKMIASMTEDYYERGTFSSTASAPAASVSENDAALSVLPNPAGNRATIRMTLAGPGEATLRIINSLGQTVLNRELAARPAGTYDEQIDASGLPSGVYFVTVETGGSTSRTRLVLKQ